MKAYELPIRQLLTRLANELEILRRLGSRIEVSICAGLLSGAADNESFGDVQEIDHLLQQLTVLRDFLTTLADETRGEQRINVENALACITLDGVRARMAGSSEEQAEAEQTHRNPDVF